jgi:hypothetical protein
MPRPWLFILVALATYRVVRLVGWDDLTTGWRAWYGGMSDAEYRQWNPVLNEIVEKDLDPWQQEFSGKTLTFKGPPFTPTQWYLAKMVRCPWCLGFWASLLAAIAWWIIAGGTIAWIPLVALALSATVGFLAKNLDS